MSWDEIVSALSMLWARQKPELLQLLQPGLNKALRLALVGTVLMAVLLAALLAVRLVKSGFRWHLYRHSRRADRGGHIDRYGYQFQRDMGAGRREARAA